MEFLKIKETCLYLRDMEKAKAFYNSTLGLPVIHHEAGKHIFFKAGTSVLLCFNADDSRLKTSPPPHYGGGKQHFAFEVLTRDYEQVKKEIAAKGISITATLQWASGAESFYFEDPEGNVLEIVPDTGVWN